MPQFARPLAIFLLLTLFVAGCGSSNQNPTLPAPPQEVTSVPDPDDGAYPAPLLEIEPMQERSGYPAPQAEMPDPADAVPNLELPLQLEQSEIGATVGGIIVNRITQQAPAEGLVYLGRLQFTEAGLPVISLNRQAAPVIILPRNGAFIFENLEPGSYAPVIFTPEYSTLIEDENGINITFTVSDGDVIDLGKMIVDIP
jgi:hypothetical protein